KAGRAVGKANSVVEIALPAWPSAPRESTVPTPCLDEFGKPCRWPIHCGTNVEHCAGQRVGHQPPQGGVGCELAGQLGRDRAISGQLTWQVIQSDQRGKRHGDMNLGSSTALGPVATTATSTAVGSVFTADPITRRGLAMASSPTVAVGAAAVIGPAIVVGLAVVVSPLSVVGPAAVTVGLVRVVVGRARVVVSRVGVV